jgi:hypothetical protein
MNFEAARLSFADVDKPIKLRVEGTYQGTTIKTEATLGSLDNLLRPRTGAHFPVALKVAFGRSELEIDVKADLTAKVPTAQGRVRPSTSISTSSIRRRGAARAPATGACSRPRRSRSAF